MKYILMLADGLFTNATITLDGVVGKFTKSTHAFSFYWKDMLNSIDRSFRNQMKRQHTNQNMRVPLPRAWILTNWRVVQLQWVQLQWSRKVTVLPLFIPPFNLHPRKERMVNCVERRMTKMYLIRRNFKQIRWINLYQYQNSYYHLNKFHQ